MQPVFPYFLRNRLNDPKRAGEREAIDIAYRELYTRVGSALYQRFKANEPEQRQVGQIVAELEYANLLHALTLALQHRVTMLRIWTPIQIYLDRTNNHARWVAVGEVILSGLDHYSAEQLTGQLGGEFAATLGDLGTGYCRVRRYEKARDARKYFLKTLAILVEFKDDQQTAITLISLTRLWWASEDEDLPAAVGEILGLAADQASELLRSALPEAD